jgi:hypothetical protein
MPFRNVLVFVEDPGAANFVAALPEELRARGISPTIYAVANGAVQLDRLGVEYYAEFDPERALSGTEFGAAVIGSSENPDGVGASLTASAKSRGIPTVGIVDGPANAHLRFRGRRGDEGIPTLILVPDIETGHRFEASGIAPERIVVCGYPHFDTVRKMRMRLEQEGQRSVRARIFPALDQTRPLIMFAAELSDGLDRNEFRRNRDYTLAGDVNSDLRTNIVLAETLLALGQIDPAPVFVLRLHPKNSRDEFTDFETRIDFLSDTGSAIECAFAADLVVGMTSILLAEAALLGRKTLSILPRESEKDWLATIGAGLTPAVSRREDILPALMRGLFGDAPDETAIAAFAPPGASGRAAEAIVMALERGVRRSS